MSFSCCFTSSSWSKVEAKVQVERLSFAHLVFALCQLLVEDQRRNLSDVERMKYFKEQTELREFTRKDYLHMFKDISTANATRDLKKGVAKGILFEKEKTGWRGTYLAKSKLIAIPLLSTFVQSFKNQCRLKS